MQINRLFEIVYLLLSSEGRTMTAAELAAHFEVSVRTVYRDVETLCQAGIPIYTCKGKGGGISLLENFILNKSLLSQEEKNEMLWALQGSRGVKAIEGETLSRLKSLFGENAQDWIEIDFSDWGEYRAGIFQKIKQGVMEKRTLEFDYYNTRGESRRRLVEPSGLWFKSKSWYLRAFCRESKGMRVFKINRIRNLEVKEENFVPRSGSTADLEESKGWRRSGNVRIVLRISGSQAFRVYDEFPEEVLFPQEDGSFLAEYDGPEDEWVYSSILSYGPEAEVIEPERIRNIVKEKLEKTREIYS